MRSSEDFVANVGDSIGGGGCQEAPWRPSIPPPRILIEHRLERVPSGEQKKKREIE